MLEEAADEELLQAVHLAVRGETYLNPRLGARLATAPAGPPDDLTEGVRTVETHRAHIQQKLRRSTRAELVRYALDHGLIGP